MDEMSEEFYSWNPNVFQIKNPETGYYYGNVIGNLSKEDQMQIVSTEGSVQKDAILEVSEPLIDEIDESAKKFIDIMTLSDDTMREIILFFGGVFILDTAILGSTPLG